MNILFVSSRVPYPVVDGHTNRTYHILKGLAEGNNIDLLALAQAGEASNGKNIRILKELCCSVEIVSGPQKEVSLPMLWRLFISLASKQPYTIWRHYSKGFERLIKEITQSKHYDIIHFDVLPVAAYRHAAGGGICSITDHDVCYVKTRRMASGAKNLPLKFFLYLESLKLYGLEKTLAREFDLVIAVSGVDARLLEKAAGRDGVLVIPNGVDTKLFAPEQEIETGDNIVWVGGMSYFPNFEAVSFFVNEIFPLIKQRRAKARFTVVGEFKKTKKFVDQHESTDTEFVGFVDDVTEYVRQARVFVAPIRSGSGTRIKLLEAMAMGKAIVTTTISCEGIEGRNGEEFLIADDPGEFAHCVIELLRDQKLRERLGASARKLVQRKYDWGFITQGLTKSYQAKLIEYRRFASLPKCG